MNLITKFKKLTTENWQAKLLCLALAILTWTTVKYGYMPRVVESTTHEIIRSHP